MSLIFVSAVVSVGLSAVGPRVLGRATDLIFAGAVAIFGSSRPAILSLIVFWILVLR